MKITEYLKIKFVKKPLGRTALAAIAIPASAIAIAASAAAIPASASTAGGGGCGACPGQLFIASAVEHPNGTVTLPLHQGISNGQPVYYVITDASDGSLAQSLGVNTSQKLANAASTAVAGNTIVPSRLMLTFSTPAVLAALASFCEVLSPIAAATEPSEASVTT